MSDEKSKTELTDESLRVNQAAKILNVSPRTIWRMIADGQLTAKRFRRCTRLSLVQVLSYLTGNGKVGGV
jgi:excisionase family DNA binding protein